VWWLEIRDVALGALQAFIGLPLTPMHQVLDLQLEGRFAELFADRVQLQGLLSPVALPAPE